MQFGHSYFPNLQVVRLSLLLTLLLPLTVYMPQAATVSEHADISLPHHMALLLPQSHCDLHLLATYWQQLIASKEEAQSIYKWLGPAQVIAHLSCWPGAGHTGFEFGFFFFWKNHKEL